VIGRRAFVGPVGDQLPCGEQPPPVVAGECIQVPDGHDHQRSLPVFYPHVVRQTIGLPDRRCQGSAGCAGGALAQLTWMVMPSLCRMVPSSPSMSRLRSNADPGVKAVLLRSNSTAPAAGCGASTGDRADLRDRRARAGARAAEQRARIELATRGVDPDSDDRDTTAEQWLAAHRADQAIEDQHRQITDEDDLTDRAEARDRPSVSSSPFPPSMPQKPVSPTSATKPAASRNARRARSTTGPGYQPRTRPPTASPAHGVRWPNSRPAVSTTSAAPRKTRVSANLPSGITVTAPPTPAPTNATSISAEPFDPGSTRADQPAAADDTSSGGSPDPYQTHANVAATPRARSRSDASAVNAAMYSASIVSGIAA
jgi:hypothetical protein